MGVVLPICGRSYNCKKLPEPQKWTVLHSLFREPYMEHPRNVIVSLKRGTPT